ncbi:MAG: helix-turn-helix transcriptional regulator [Leptonema illini]|jgi:DNA-binding PadR family transcriptional regulator|uniref:Helix-turn-helix transcriptional regulator n=1 Tax=Leptonema illini TaxID=183 RepID=A0A833H0Q9_9LEPT|nr:MAG: helix-turn-helix transcriptional regulator [Leptonema illini]
MTEPVDPADREIRLAIWKIHILHHAAEGPIYGLWMMHELAEHGHRLSPGTLYPILSRMEKNGWLTSVPGQSRRERREYRITKAGRSLLARLRSEIKELHDELTEEKT